LYFLDMQALLKKRVIILTAPPVDESCQAALACASLGGRTIAKDGFDQGIRAFGYQNLSDIPMSLPPRAASLFPLRGGGDPCSLMVRHGCVPQACQRRQLCLLRHRDHL
jgi:hypothetical protein